MVLYFPISDYSSWPRTSNRRCAKGTDSSIAEQILLASQNSLAMEQSVPFAPSSNVTFSGTPVSFAGRGPREWLLIVPSAKLLIELDLAGRYLNVERDGV